MLRWASAIRSEHPYEKLAGTVTQFVVGAVGDTDAELLSVSSKLYRQMGLTRAYYSGFSPVEQTPFENLPPTDPLREFRLYQASFLLRDYGWNVEDLAFQEDGNLRTDIDPKKAWAETHLNSCSNRDHESWTAAITARARHRAKKCRCDHFGTPSGAFDRAITLAKTAYCRAGAGRALYSVEWAQAASANGTLLVTV